MSDWLTILVPMEETLAGMLARAHGLANAEASEPPLSGALPLLEEVLAPAGDRVAQAERLAQEADALLEDASLMLTAWRQRSGALQARLANPPPRAVS